MRPQHKPAMKNIPYPACRNVFLVFLLALFLLPAAAANGAPAAKLWPRWQTHDQYSQEVVDHMDWNLMLQRYVDSRHPSGINRFRYSSVTPADREILERYLQTMQSLKVSDLSRQEQKAYWINLYNALTVKVVLDHYPVRSIRMINLPPGFFSRGPWDAKLLTIEGEEVSLNDIEHRILRPIWKDPRVHYAINCASIGCPNLQPQAYTGDNAELLLEKAAREFINHPRGVSFPSNRLQISSIYFWFQEDFGGSEKGIIKHLRKYLSEKNLEQLDKVQKNIGHKYDWNLNE